MLKVPCSLSLQGTFLLYEQRGWEKFFTVQTKGYMFVVINFTCIIYHDILEESNKYVLYFTLLSINHKFTNWTIDIIVTKLKTYYFKGGIHDEKIPIAYYDTFYYDFFFSTNTGTLKDFPSFTKYTNIVCCYFYFHLLSQ
jgi:hypothetical protein